MFEITLAPVADLVVYEDTDITPNYTLSNLELEYSCISSDVLASQASSVYQIGIGLQYENIILHKTFTIDNKQDEVINQHINLPRRSMTGILCLFTLKLILGVLEILKNLLTHRSPQFKSILMECQIDSIPKEWFPPIFGKL